MITQPAGPAATGSPVIQHVNDTLQVASHDGTLHDGTLHDMTPGRLAATDFKPLTEEQCRLVVAFRGFAVGVTWRYREVAALRGLPLEDLQQEAFWGLCMAAQRYVPRQGVQFQTYAYYWVKKYILQALGKECYTRIASVELLSQESVELLGQESVELLGQEGVNLHGGEDGGYGEPPYGPYLDDDDSQQVRYQEQLRQLDHLLGCLAPVERRVVCLMYGLPCQEADGQEGCSGEPMTWKQVAQQLHLGPARVRLICQQALTKMELAAQC